MKNNNQTEDVMVDGEISISEITSLFEKNSEKNSATIEEALGIEEEGEANPNDTPKPKEEEKGESPKEDRKKEIEESKEKSDEIVSDTTKSQSSKVKELIKLGLLEDIRVSFSEDDDEGKLLSEQDSLTDEQIQSIVEAQNSKRKEALEKDYLKKSDFQEHHLKIIEILKNGGDLREVFSNPADSVRRPFEGMDFDKVENQRKIAFAFYTENKGLPEKEALSLIAQKEKDFELDSFAKELHTAYNKAYDNYLETVKVNKQKEKEEAQKALQQRRKMLSERFKSQNIKENIYNKVVDGVTKPTEDGRLQIHKILDDILANPEENYEILLHMVDQKAFKDLYNIKKQEEKTQEVLRLFDAMPKSKSNKRDTEEKKFTSEIEEEIANMQFKIN